MPRFVIQRHTQPEQSHWDLMLEVAATQKLATWQVPRPPREWPEILVSCTKLEDHRLDYLTYEGPVSGNRGEVEIFAAGDYHELHIADSIWRVYLCSDNILGTLEMSRQKEKEWQLHFQGMSL